MTRRGDGNCSNGFWDRWGRGPCCCRRSTPGVTLTTTGHPIHPDSREDLRRFSKPIVIEDKVWIGSNAVVLPGVRIGFGAVIGAGSVVSRDIPPMTVAVGTPCRVVRPVTDDDRA